MLDRRRSPAYSFSMKSEDVDALVQLGEITLRLARVERATRHEDGEHPESDTDHTVMLGLMACALAARFAPDLDRGRIAEFALVHDLVEAYAGDTNTFGFGGDTSTTDKDAREAAALERIRHEIHASFPWVVDTIEAYESLATPEARFVKTLDKVLPKITHYLNHGTELPNLEEFDSHCMRQEQKLRQSYGEDQELVLVLYRTMYERSRARLAARLENLQRL